MSLAPPCPPSRSLWKDVAIPWGDPRSRTLLGGCALVLARPPGFFPLSLLPSARPPPCPSVKWPHVWALPGPQAAAGSPWGLATSAPAWARAGPGRPGLSVGPKQNPEAGMMAGALACARQLREQGPPARTLPEAHRRQVGPGTRGHTRPSLVRRSEPCAGASRTGNCALELQSRCLAPQPNGVKWSRKQLRDTGRPCRERGARALVQGLGVRLARAHTLPLSPLPQLHPALFVVCP